MRTYELMATPLIYPGRPFTHESLLSQQTQAKSLSASMRSSTAQATSLSGVRASPFCSVPASRKPSRWPLPDTDGQPIQSIGIAVRSPGVDEDGAVVLDWLGWDGPPNVRLRRPRDPSDFWRRAWVNAVSDFSTSFPQAFRVSQDRGEGMIICGGRQWSDYRVETALTIHLAEFAGIGVRVQGLRRFYAALLVRPDVLRLVRVRDGETTVLAEAPFAWTFEKPYKFRIEAVGPSIEISVDGVSLQARDESPHAIADGGVALIIANGAASSNEVLVAPPGATPR